LLYLLYHRNPVYLILCYDIWHRMLLSNKKLFQYDTAAGYSEMSVHIYQTIQCHIPEEKMLRVKKSHIKLYWLCAALMEWHRHAVQMGQKFSLFNNNNITTKLKSSNLCHSTREFKIPHSYMIKGNNFHIWLLSNTWQAYTLYLLYF
jgi:hypothetical protein